MKPNTVAGIVGVAALAACTATWLLLPSLQASQAAVDATAAVQLERARRLLHEYHAGLQYKSILLERLRESGVDVDVSDQEEFSDAEEQEYQTRLEAQWAQFTPMDWGMQPRPARPASGSPASEIKKGVAGRRTAIAENEKLLSAALAAVNEGLKLQSGGASAQSHAELLRLKGTVLYFSSIHERIGAALKRIEAESRIHDLADLGTRASALAPLGTLVKDSLIEEQINSLTARRAEVEQSAARNREAVAALDSRIRGLESQHAAAYARAQETRRVFDAQVAAGVDFNDPKGGETFAVKLADADRAYRQALREVHVLQFGDYAKAEVDSSGDFLIGTYVEAGTTGPLSLEYGLTHYRDQRAILTKAADANDRSLDDLRTDIARLESLRNAAQETQERAAQDSAEVLKSTQSAYDAWNRLDSEAAALEGKALALLDQSAAACKQAAASVSQWINLAREPAQAVSETAKPRSAWVQRLQNNWMTGYTAVQEADAQWAKAWIHSSRYQAYTQASEVLAEVTKAVSLADFKPEALEEKRADAQENGVAAINQAMVVLERGFKDTGKHWTLVAQQAGTIYLLALLGHPSFIPDSIESYRAAVKGREDKPFAERIVSRLKRLELRNP